MIQEPIECENGKAILGDLRRLWATLGDFRSQSRQAYSGILSHRNFRRLKAIYATLGKFGQNVARLKAI